MKLKLSVLFLLLMATVIAAYAQAPARSYKQEAFPEYGFHVTSYSAHPVDKVVGGKVNLGTVTTFTWADDVTPFEDWKLNKVDVFENVDYSQRNAHKLLNDGWLAMVTLDGITPIGGWDEGKDHDGNETATYKLSMTTVSDDDTKVTSHVTIRLIAVVSTRRFYILTEIRDPDASNHYDMEFINSFYLLK
jgi:hypothetical protein